MTTRRFWGSDADGGEQRHRRMPSQFAACFFDVRSVRDGVWACSVRLQIGSAGCGPGAVISWIDADDFRVSVHIYTAPLVLLSRYGISSRNEGSVNAAKSTSHAGGQPLRPAKSSLLQFQFGGHGLLARSVTFLSILSAASVSILVLPAPFSQDVGGDLVQSG